MINILLVEDSDEFRKLMRIHLEREGYGIWEAADGREALSLLEHGPVHLIVADVMMPHMDGYALTAELRSAGVNLPILMVSARDMPDDKFEGFSCGADDYMTKPLNMKELVFRVKALLRRSQVSEVRVLTIGETTLNMETLQVLWDGNVLALRQKEFLLLYKLLSYPSRIFTRQMLMDEIWGYESKTDPRSVDTHVKRLREKLAGTPDFEIQTVRGLGYRAVIRS